MVHLKHVDDYPYFPLCSQCSGGFFPSGGNVCLKFGVFNKSSWQVEMGGWVRGGCEWGVWQIMLSVKTLFRNINEIYTRQYKYV